MRTSILANFKGGLIVSCQPVPNGAMDTDEIVLAMALAAQEGGAVGVRIEGVERVRLVARHLHIPVVGIAKRNLTNSDIRITPWIQDVLDLSQAGASVVAVDATNRPRAVAVSGLLAAIQKQNRVAMADCATLDDGLQAHAMGFDIIGSTLSGYTTGTACAPAALPDKNLVQALAAHGCWVVAEGRIRSAGQAREALGWGASAVTVGSALTRLEWMVADYVQTMKARR